MHDYVRKPIVNQETVRVLTFAPEILGLLLNVDGVADVDLDLVLLVAGHEPVEPPVGRLQQLQLVGEDEGGRRDGGRRRDPDRDHGRRVGLEAVKTGEGGKVNV